MDEFAFSAWVGGCDHSRCPIRDFSLFRNSGIRERELRRNQFAHRRRLAGKLSRVSARDQTARVS